MAQLGPMREKSELLDELKILLDNFFYGMKRGFQQAKSISPLPEGQFFLMLILWEQGRYKVSDIAARLGLTAGAVTAMTDKLAAEELIERERSEADRRVVWLSLTDKGRQVIQMVQNSRYQYFRERFQNLQTDDLQKAVEVFEKLNQELDQERP